MCVRSGRRVVQIPILGRHRRLPGRGRRHLPHALERLPLVERIVDDTVFFDLHQSRLLDRCCICSYAHVAWPPETAFAKVRELTVAENLQRLALERIPLSLMRGEGRGEAPTGWKGLKRDIVVGEIRRAA